MIKSFIKELPEDIPVTLEVLSIFKKDEADSCFKLECRILDGAHRNECINLWFYRKKLDGSEHKVTSSMLRFLVGGSEPDRIPSWKLQGITFECTPVRYAKSRYQLFRNFKLIRGREVD